jgi:hypothetical protein
VIVFVTEATWITVSGVIRRFVVTSARP